MIRRLVDWLLYMLHIKHRQDKSVIESLEELMPFLYACLVIMGMWKSIKVSLPKLPWYTMAWQWIKFHIQRARTIAIGY